MQVQETIKILELQKEDLKTKIASIDMTIETLKQSVGYNSYSQENIKTTSTVSPEPNGWDKKTTIKSKINFLLKNNKRFLHSREMADLAHGYEPELSVEEWLAKFSPQLSSLKRDGHIVSKQIGKSLRNTFWGSPKWLDENNEILTGYQYNNKYLFEVGGSEFKI